MLFVDGRDEMYKCTTLFCDVRFHGFIDAKRNIGQWLQTLEMYGMELPKDMCRPKTGTLMFPYHGNVAEIMTWSNSRASTVVNFLVSVTAYLLSQR